LRRLVGWGRGSRPGSTSTPARSDAQTLTSLSEYRLQASAVALPPEVPDGVVGTNEHGSYCVPRASLHRPVARAIIDARVWERTTLDLLRDTDPEGDIVHAGTFFGDFIPALARSRNLDAQVWAFEPNRENYECAWITVLLNNLDNVVLRHAGLDASSGTALLATSDRDGLPLGGGSHLISDSSRSLAASSEEVPLMSVDDAVPNDRPVAVIQLDVEGHEQEALAGALETIARSRPLIVLETLPPESWIAEHLSPLEYRVAGTVDENTVLRPA
jgi:FkbM family methyltransferase